MKSLNKNNNQDDDLIYFFENFETILSNKAPDVEEISNRVDFKVFGEYFTHDIREIQQRLDGADDDYLLYVSEHIFNIIDWLQLILENRDRAFGEALERLFDQTFGDKRILHTTYRASFDRWIVGKQGQYKIGVNTYSITNETLYYRDRVKQWFKVDRDTVFDIKPIKEPVTDESRITHLNEGYKDTSYDLIIKKWESKNYNNALPQDFSEFSKETTTPEEYFRFTTDNIRALLNNPVSIAELERWNGESITDLEDIVKLCMTTLDVVKERREDDSHTVYLLRDCMIFYEINKTLDILSSKEVSSDQLLIGRKALSNAPDQQGYYIVILEALYEAHGRYSDNFSDFYDEFARLLDLFASIDPGFMGMIDNSTDYIKAHIQTNKDKIVIFDVGFQGTINLFIKYVIDRYINTSASKPHPETEIEVSIGALWSKELFGSRARGYYFPFLNRLQLLARSDELYHYKFGSLDSGSVEVTMGSKEWQQKAATELVTLVMVTQLVELG